MIEQAQTQAVQTQVYNDANVRQHYASMQAGALLPFAQAGITALCVGLAAGGVVLVVKYPVSALAWMVGALFVTLAVSWLALLKRWIHITNELERALGIDLDGDNTIGGKQTVRVELVRDGGKHVELIDLPCDLDRLREFAGGALDGRLSESSWIGRDGIFTRAEFVRLRDEMVKRGLLMWSSREHSRGLAISRAGRAAFTYLAEIHSPALSQAERYTDD